MIVNIVAKANYELIFFGMVKPNPIDLALSFELPAALALSFEKVLFIIIFLIKK